jgi:hypothetical protein
MLPLLAQSFRRRHPTGTEAFGGLAALIGDAGPRVKMAQGCRSATSAFTVSFGG